MEKIESSVSIIGTVVRSKRGRDRKRVFIVVDIDENSPESPIVIANGKLRKLEDRKHKNPVHLEYVGILDKSDIERLENGLSNGEIAEICNKHDFRQKKC